MMHSLRNDVAWLVILLLSSPALAAGLTSASPIGLVAMGGSTAFCLYELPGDDSGKRRWINLGIVQYIEAAPTELKIAYGGGSFGSGFDARIPLANADEALATIERMRKTAAACRE